MKKELKEGMGFICANLEEKKRIWQKLTDAGYKVCDKIDEDELKRWKHIFWSTGLGEFHLTNSLSHITDPLNESDFFDEWTPKAGDWVEVSDDGKTWFPEPQVFVVKWNNLYYSTSGVNNCLWPSNHIRQIKPETMTLQEVREALGKPNLIVTQ
jgi:hypothetical protein